jgi:hypothetical protein
MKAPFIVGSGSEATMKSLRNLMLWTAVAVTTLTLTAAAQNVVPRADAPAPRLITAVYLPSQDAAKLMQVDWDDHRRGDGDRDRDDRNRQWRDRDGDRYYYRGNAYVGNGYAYGPAYSAYYGPSGWYDKYGRWHRDKDHDRR